MESKPADIPRAAAVRALALHDVIDAVRNLTALAMFAACAFLVLVFATVVNGDLFGQTETHAFLMTVAVVLPPAFVGSAIALYAMAEERERGVHLTLAEAGASAGQIAVGKLAAAFLWTIVTAAVLCVVVGFSARDALAVVAITVPASLPVLLASLSLGMLADNQTLTSIMSVPITVVAVAPILGFLSDGIRVITCALPMGPAAELLRFASGAEPLYAPAVAFALLAAWIAAGVAFAAWARTRFARSIAAARDRHRAC